MIHSKEEMEALGNITLNQIRDLLTEKGMSAKEVGSAVNDLVKDLLINQGKSLDYIAAFGLSLTMVALALEVPAETSLGAFLLRTVNPDKDTV
jgi:hypothetical protein